jgi:hypothetical protein
MGRDWQARLRGHAAPHTRVLLRIGHANACLRGAAGSAPPGPPVSRAMPPVRRGRPSGPQPGGVRLEHSLDRPRTLGGMPPTSRAAKAEGQFAGTIPWHGDSGACLLR